MRGRVVATGDEVQFATMIIIFIAAGKGDFEASLIISEKHFRHSRTKREFFFELKCMHAAEGRFSVSRHGMLFRIFMKTHYYRN